MIKKYNITVNGNSYEVEVEELGSQASTVSRPQTVQSTPRPQVTKSQAQKAPVAQAIGGGSVQAPMPGTINDVRVKVGDNVKKGQVLLILEAMKMENEIVAPRDGVVNNISVDKGQNVNHGEKLLEMA